MLPTKQIQVITTNTHLSVCPHCWLQTFAGFLQCWNYSCIESWNYSEAPPCLWLQAAHTKPWREWWVLPLVKQGWKGAPAVLCLPTPCQGFSLLPGSALQTPGQPGRARDVRAGPSSPVIPTATCHPFHTATQHLRKNKTAGRIPFIIINRNRSAFVNLGQYITLRVHYKFIRITAWRKFYSLAPAAFSHATDL